MKGSSMPQDDEGVFLDPEPEDGNEAAPGKRSRPRQSGWPAGPYAAVPIQWISKKPCPFDAKGRVFLALLDDSRSGQRTVRMTDPTIASLQIPERTKQWCVTRLLRDGWLRVDYEGPGHALLITVLVQAG
jgi:hypothetical protein